MNGSDLGACTSPCLKTAALCIVGAASISAFPLFSGFVSKSMVMSAALEEGTGLSGLHCCSHQRVCSSCRNQDSFLCIFAHDSGIRVKEAPASMLVAMDLLQRSALGLAVFQARCIACFLTIRTTVPTTLHMSSHKSNCYCFLPSPSCGSSCLAFTRLSCVV